MLQDGKVMCCSELPRGELVKLCLKYRLTLNVVDGEQNIPGSFWNESEAGLISSNIFIRADTPVHSLLHELCHFVCMDAERRHKLHTNAGGTAVEESAVCYLQVILSDYLAGYSRANIFSDMDAWGYSFRLGATQAWFEQDAEDAQAFLLKHGIVAADLAPSWSLRQ